MTERQVRNGLKTWHRWLGLGAAVFLLVTALTGFLLEHPGWLGDGPTAPTALAADPERPGRWLRGGRWGGPSKSIRKTPRHSVIWRW